MGRQFGLWLLIGTRERGNALHIQTIFCAAFSLFFSIFFASNCRLFTLFFNMFCLKLPPFHSFFNMFCLKLPPFYSSSICFASNCHRFYSSSIYFASNCHLFTLFQYVFFSNCNLFTFFSISFVSIFYIFYLLFKNILNFLGAGRCGWVENIKDPLMIQVWRNERAEMKMLFIIHTCEKIPRNRNGTAQKIIISILKLKF